MDSGFIVHNDRTYPLLQRLFAELGVKVRATEMSMSIRCEGCGLEFAGGRGARGVLAQPRRVLDPSFLRLIAQIRRFQRSASDYLDESSAQDASTYGEFLAANGFSVHFVNHYAVPVVSCVWSAGHDDALRYPARYLFTFLRHHGFLELRGAPQWYTVVGGSSTYVERIAAKLTAVRTSAPVRAIARGPDGVLIRDGEGNQHRVDRVVIATHADHALSLLDDASDHEREVLSAFAYTRNSAVLHTDATLLPRAGGARASWNYLMSSCTHRRDSTLVSYWMNRLQGHDGDEQYLVSLNAAERIDPARVIARVEYEHPLYTPQSLAAQRRLGDLNTSTAAFAGAYHGWGFHEDGCRSGVEAARALGVTW